MPESESSTVIEDSGSDDSYSTAKESSMENFDLEEDGNKPKIVFKRILRSRIIVSTDVSMLKKYL